ncbi:hypothetical protein [Acinetobacter junii]|uniref:hypothetical protein n=1 Tax=Acinetobacter junii TaxID=40215 RepID=UPI00124FB363|nr:hypothetical protein [Acinetobacter junii]
MKRAITQDDWKRSQIRMPQDKYDEIMEYAKNNNISLNTAMLELIDRGLKIKEQGSSFGLGSYHGAGLGLPPYPGEDISKLTDEIADKVVGRLKEQNKD